jgi:hypothetical protein
MQFTSDLHTHAQEHTHTCVGMAHMIRHTQNNKITHTHTHIKVNRTDIARTGHIRRLQAIKPFGKEEKVKVDRTLTISSDINFTQK